MFYQEYYDPYEGCIDYEYLIYLQELESFNQQLLEDEQQQAELDSAQQE